MANPKAHFVQQVAPYVALHIKNAKICGVSFVPIHVYGAGVPALIGKTCVVLGKERGGIYVDKFNFFGGKTSDKSTSKTPDHTTITQVLYEEVLEELGIALDPQCFIRSLVDIVRKPSGHHGDTLVFFCHITGIRRIWWDKIMKDRVTSNPSLDWKYQEMSEIAHVPIDELATPKVSKYVNEMALDIQSLVIKLPYVSGVSIRSFQVPKI